MKKLVFVGVVLFGISAVGDGVWGIPHQQNTNNNLNRKSKLNRSKASNSKSTNVRSRNSKQFKQNKSKKVVEISDETFYILKFFINRISESDIRLLISNISVLVKNISIGNKNSDAALVISLLNDVVGNLEELLKVRKDLYQEFYSDSEKDEGTSEIVNIKYIISDLNHIDLNKLNEIIILIQQSNMSKRVTKNLQYFMEKVGSSKKALRDITKKCTPLIIARIEGIPYAKHMNDINEILEEENRLNTEKINKENEDQKLDTELHHILEDMSPKISNQSKVENLIRLEDDDDINLDYILMDNSLESKISSKDKVVDEVVPVQARLDEAPMKEERIQTEQKTIQNTDMLSPDKSFENIDKLKILAENQVVDAVPVHSQAGEKQSKAEQTQADPTVLTKQVDQELTQNMNISSKENDFLDEHIDLEDLLSVQEENSSRYPSDLVKLKTAPQQKDSENLDDIISENEEGIKEALKSEEERKNEKVIQEHNEDLRVSKEEIKEGKTEEISEKTQSELIKEDQKKEEESSAINLFNKVNTEKDNFQNNQKTERVELKSKEESKNEKMIQGQDEDSRKNKENTKENKTEEITENKLVVSNKETKEKKDQQSNKERQNETNAEDQKKEEIDKNKQIESQKQEESNKQNSEKKQNKSVIEDQQKENQKREEKAKVFNLFDWFNSDDKKIEPGDNVAQGTDNDLKNKQVISNKKTEEKADQTYDKEKKNETNTEDRKKEEWDKNKSIESQKQEESDKQNSEERQNGSIAEGQQKESSKEGEKEKGFSLFDWFNSNDKKTEEDKNVEQVKDNDLKKEIENSEIKFEDIDLNEIDDMSLLFIMMEHRVEQLDTSGAKNKVKTDLVRLKKNLKDAQTADRTPAQQISDIRNIIKDYNAVVANLKTKEGKMFSSIPRGRIKVFHEVIYSNVFDYLSSNLSELELNEKLKGIIKEEDFDNVIALNNSNKEKFFESKSGTEKRSLMKNSIESYDELMQKITDQRMNWLNRKGSEVDCERLGYILDHVVESIDISN